jgi:hypothetical protein
MPAPLNPPKLQLVFVPAVGSPVTVAEWQLDTDTSVSDAPGDVSLGRCLEVLQVYEPSSPVVSPPVPV